MNRRIPAKWIVIVLMVASALPIHAQQFGWYVGRVVTAWDENHRTMTLLEDFGYVDPSGVQWRAPAGSRIDGASIPRIAWSIVGGPYEEAYRNASVIHDVACVDKSRPWQQVHETFYYAMRASGVGALKAKLMYRAVYIGGPKWSLPGEVMGGGPTPVLTEAQLREDAQAIEQREQTGRPMTLEEIRNLPIR
jgi:hypothetical protein